MKQIRQYLRDGRLEAGEVPLPAVGSGDVLVRTAFSFVSVGTEKMKVTQARMGLVEKARERPDQVRQVIQTVKEQGIGPTLRKVEERLSAPTTLGYSCAGTVAAVGSAVETFRVGDRVAAIGEGLATHAEYNAVPRNLVVAVPSAVSLELASTSAIGAIALQSLRQARLELGESVAVIGLGLLGQFLVQLVRASGCRVIGVDLDPSKCNLALRSGAEAACGPESDEALSHALRVSAGAGVDAVLVTTSTRRQAADRAGRGAGPRPRPRGMPRQHSHRARLAHLVWKGDRLPLQPRDGSGHVRSRLPHAREGLPDWLRALDREQKHGRLSRPHRAAPP